ITNYITILIKTFHILEKVILSIKGQCDTVKWASCSTAPPCQCTIPLTKDINQPLNCNALVPKCFLMKVEMLRRSKGQDTRTVGKPGEGFVDNDVLYDPECESDGKFKAKQCNNTEECWCVNSAGVRRTEKEVFSVSLPESHFLWILSKFQQKELPVALCALGDAIQARYKFDKSLVEDVEYDVDAKKIQVDIKKPMNDTNIKLADMAYYMEREIKKTPMIFDQNKFAPMVGGQKLDFTNIWVYYVDEEPPTFKMNRLAGGGVIAAIVVVLLIVAAGLLLLFFWNRRNKKYRKTQVRHFLSVFLGL
uniref:Epithelial cell adhesion molecule n=1 Tax=Oryzias latipes TaxID=8090 RepID=A0A3P9J4Q4_ORYLA